MLNNNVEEIKINTVLNERWSKIKNTKIPNSVTTTPIPTNPDRNNPGWNLLFPDVNNKKRIGKYSVRCFKPFIDGGGKEIYLEIKTSDEPGAETYFNIDQLEGCFGFKNIKDCIELMNFTEGIEYEKLALSPEEPPQIFLTYVGFIYFIHKSFSPNAKALVMMFKDIVSKALERSKKGPPFEMKMLLEQKDKQIHMYEERIRETKTLYESLLKEKEDKITLQSEVLSILRK